jgi:hypothetical protein
MDNNYKIGLEHNRDNFKIDLKRAKDYAIYLNKLYKNNKEDILKTNIVNNNITITILENTIKDIISELKDL